MWMKMNYSTLIYPTLPLGINMDVSQLFPWGTWHHLQNLQIEIADKQLEVSTTPMKINSDKPFSEIKESVINEQFSSLFKELDVSTMTPNKTLDHWILCKSLGIRKPLNVLTCTKYKGRMTYYHSLMELSHIGCKLGS